MAPQFYEVDVYAGTRQLADQTFRVVIDWDPDNADYIDRLLNAHVAAAVRAARALTADLAEYRLVAFEVDRHGRRGRDQAWVWRSPLDLDERPPWRR